MKRILTISGLFLGFMTSLQAQSSPADTKPEDPNVFLDNNRPLVPKKTKAATARTVIGTVTDDTGRPLEGALVTLTRVKTKEKQNFFTKKDGKYTFDDLAFTEDFEVQAKWKTLISETRKLSQYDHTVKAVRLLQVRTPEGYSNASAAAAADVKTQTPKN